MEMGNYTLYITFDTSSTSPYDITLKSELPVTITVTKDSITDATTLSKLEGGASNEPMFFIRSPNVVHK